MARPADPETVFVLHRRPYGETSLLVELFAEQSGRVGTVARGGRKPRRGLLPLEPFRPFRASWSGRGGLRTLRGWEPAEEGPGMAGQSLYLGFYLNELLMRLCARFDPYPRVFAAYRETLQALAEGGRDRPLRLFEAGLLRELGLVPDWDRCGGCGRPVQEDDHFAWDPRIGLACRDCTSGDRPYSGCAIRLLMEDREAGRAERRQVRDLMRAAMAPHLGPRPLASRELLRSVSRAGDRGKR